MKFWDASAIVPLLMTEPTTKVVQALASRLGYGLHVACFCVLR